MPVSEKMLLLLILATVVLFILSSKQLSKSISWTAFIGTNEHRAEDRLLGGDIIFWEKKENSTYTAKATEPQTDKTAIKTESHQVKTLLGGDAETPMPALYKKSFKKLPRWDFEDVYNQDAPVRNTTCVQSLRNSDDKSFRAAFLPNIRLFLHKDNFNMSEWNRLSHFNNPFGFMEYQYNDVMASVKLIPKPNEPLLLPKPGSGGCVRCAVVGTAGILNGSRMGTEIDSHDYVFRMNGAVIKGYEEDVGNKTSVYVHTAHSITSSHYWLKKYGYTSVPTDEGIKFVLIPEGMRDFNWLQGLLRGERIAAGSYKSERPSRFYGGQYNESRFYVLHQDFLRYVRNRFLQSESLNASYWSIVRPTNGAFTIFLALHTCDTVSLYGFMTENYKQFSNYYFERNVKTRVIFYGNHDYMLEMKSWKKLHNSKIIKLYQRADSERETQKPESH